MVVGLGIITFRLHDCRSLKGKRKVIKSIIKQMHRMVINSKADKVLNMVDDLGLAEMIDSEMEILNL